MFSVNDNLLSSSRATAEQAIAGLEANVTAVDAKDREFLRALATACGETGVDYPIAVSHCANETNFFRDDNWNDRLNPAGIGITGEPDHPGPTFPNATAAARFYVALLLLKINKGGNIGAFENERETAPSFFDGTRSFARDASFPTVTTLDHLRLKFGPNNRECVWMCDQAGPIAIKQKADALFPNLPNQDATSIRVSQNGHRGLDYVLVDAGHRETGDGGINANQRERELTPGLAIAYVDALRAAGFRADWYQRDIDEDSLADMTDGSLRQVVLGANAHLVQQAGDDLLYISCHYNGPHSGYHVIYPDEEGLGTTIPGGAPGNDIEANNPLDVELARVLALELGKIPGMIPMEGAGTFSGTMREGRTGEGEKGNRLGIFAATVPVRNRCVRLVVEHGGFDDPPAQRSTFNQECAAALVRAVKIVYGGMFPEHRIPVLAAGLVDFPDAPDVTVRVQNPDKFVCIQGTTLRTYPNKEAPAGVQTPAKRGRRYRFGFASTVDGEEWLVSRRGSWAPASAFEVQNN